MSTCSIKPSGTIRYEDVKDIIETVATNKSRQFGSIAWFEQDDLKQEIRIKCIKTLPKYHSGRGDLYVFLSACADNMLRDLRRSIFYKHSKPCFTCPFWNAAAAKAGKHDCREFRNKMHCDKYAKHERYVQMKMSNSSPTTIDENRVTDSFYENMIADLDMIDYVRTCLPPDMIDSFNKLVNSNFEIKSLKPKERNALCEVLVDALIIHKEEFNEF